MFNVCEITNLSSGTIELLLDVNEYYDYCDDISVEEAESLVSTYYRVKNKTNSLRVKNVAMDYGSNKIRITLNSN